MILDLLFTVGQYCSIRLWMVMYERAWSRV